MEPEKEISFKEKRIRETVFLYYLREDVKKAMFDFSKHRECIPRYFEGFGKCLWVQRFRCPDCFAIHTCRPLGFLRGFRYSAGVIRSSLLKKIMENGWVRGVVRQNQQYWYRCLRTWASRLGNVKLPSSAHLESFFSERIFPVTEHFAPLRI